MRLSGLIGGTKDGNTVKYKLANNEFLHKVLEVVEKFSEVEVKTRWKN